MEFSEVVDGGDAEHQPVLCHRVDAALETYRVEYLAVEPLGGLPYTPLQGARVHVG